MTEQKKYYPKDHASVAWEKDEISFYLVKQRMGHWCGYCQFPKRPVIEQGYDGILTWVPVHGGITFADEYPEGVMVYGFDCAHAGDEDNPKVSDEAWLRSEAERLATNIQAVVKYEERYLLAETDKKKADVLEEYLNEVGSNAHSLVNDDVNFGAMIGLLCGRP